MLNDPHISYLVGQRDDLYDPVVTPPVVDGDNNELIRAIFEAGEDGIPRSDLGYIMSRDANPEIARYIQDNLLHSHNPETGFDSADDALDMMKRHHESVDAYRERMINSLPKPQLEDDYD